MPVYESFATFPVVAECRYCHHQIKRSTVTIGMWLVQESVDGRNKYTHVCEVLKNEDGSIREIRTHRPMRPKPEQR